jgi:hypothetical protein
VWLHAQSESHYLLTVALVFVLDAPTTHAGTDSMALEPLVADALMAHAGSDTLGMVVHSLMAQVLAASKALAVYFPKVHPGAPDGLGTGCSDI